MKQNADFTPWALDLAENMHYYACYEKAKELTED
jgi:hypothetical protein